MRLSAKEFTKFKENYNFTQKEVIVNDNGIFVDNICVDDKNGNKVWESENFINVGYNSNNGLSKILSNLYPNSFKFKGKKVASIEGVLQSLKYKDKKLQNAILKLSRIDAYHTRALNQNDFWGEEGILYWQGKEIARDSEEYQIFLNELYISCAKNPIFRKALLETGDKYLLHHIGKDDKNQTVLTRYEFEFMLMSLREYLKTKKH